MYILIAVILVGILIVAVVALYLRKGQSRKTCTNCGSPSQFGYSREAESELENIVNLCFACLVKKMTDDYESYEGRALVIQPAAGFPCYVFQTSSRWPDSKLAQEVAEMFSPTDEACNHCDSNAHYLWVSSKGLNPSTFEQVLSHGLSETLLRWGNPRPMSLCGRCCVKAIAKAIEEHRLTFLEVCSPRSANGFVIPMGY
jgi:hypothetical protein